MNEKDKNFFSRLDEIINSDNIQEIINERLKYLNSEEYKRECVVDRKQYDIVTLIKGHISPNVRVDFSAGVTENGYMYDDDSIYIDFLNNIKNCVETSGVKAKSSIVKALKKSVLEYFGNTFDDIKLFSKHINENVRMKAAGGISSLEDAEKFIELGAERLGTSKIIKLIKEEY